MSFTIIIAVKNEAQNLDLILPILLAKYPDAEILAIDGHSTDASIEVLEKYHIKHLTQNGKGKGDALRMGAANSSGGVMGKMIDAQSIVVASTATRWFNHEGDILRYVFFHSVALACLVGIFVTLQAYVYPFTLMVIQ